MKRLSDMGFEEVSATSLVDLPDGEDRMLISTRKNGCTAPLVKASETGEKGDAPIYSNSGSIPAAEKTGSPIECFLESSRLAETNKTRIAFGAAVNTWTSSIPASPARVEKGLPYIKPGYAMWDTSTLGQRLKLNTPLASFLLPFEPASLKPAEVASLITNKDPPRLILKAFSLAFNCESLFLPVLTILPDFIPASNWAVFERMKPIAVLLVYYYLFHRPYILATHMQSFKDMDVIKNFRLTGLRLSLMDLKARRLCTTGLTALKN